MALFASVTFFSALTGIVLLFTLKSVEVRRGAVFLPRLRALFDRGALRLKGFLLYVGTLISLLPPFIAALSRFIFASGARSFARMAHKSAETAHGLADFVSHKRNFERKPARSEFLRKIGEHKNSRSADSGNARPDIDIQS